MQGNVDKLTKCFLKNPIKYEFLDSLILENKEDQVFSSDALLWLKRALELIHKFFENILNDVSFSENLKDHLQTAYDCTLKQYHGWIVQNTVTLIYRWVPNRSELLGNGDSHQENLVALKTYLPVMGMHLNYIDRFLKENSLAQVKK
ncbi:GLTP family protein [Megaselia abdita]